MIKRFLRMTEDHRVFWTVLAVNAALIAALVAFALR